MPEKPKSLVPAKGEPMPQELVDLSMVSNAIKGAVQPFADAQKIAATEGTKQAKIIVGYKTKALYIGGILAALAIAVATAALFFGKDQTARDIITAAIGFAGGFGLGKGATKRG